MSCPLNVTILTGFVSVLVDAVSTFVNLYPFEVVFIPTVITEIIYLVEQG